MENYTVTAINLDSGHTVHISGKWESIEAMEKELQEDGYLVVWYTNP